MTTTTFPAPVFAVLQPAAYLHKHLTHSSDATRPNGRQPSQFRPPSLNTSSLTHTAGSAVVRIGDTAVVAGVRVELLDARDVPNHDAVLPTKSARSREEKRRKVRQLGLLVPNVEFATGCARHQIPGSAPSGFAQSMAFRIRELLLDLDLIDLSQLEITWERPNIESESEDEDESSSDADMDVDTSAPKQKSKTTTEVVAGYFVLYIDLIVISLAGTPLDALWSALLASLHTTVLPSARYSPDLDSIVASPLVSEATRLKVHGNTPLVVSFRVFEPRREKGLRHEARTWLLADADEAEEDVCAEEVVVVVELDGERGPRLRRLEKSGGCVVGRGEMREIMKMAGKRWAEWRGVLDDVME